MVITVNNPPINAGSTEVRQGLLDAVLLFQDDPNALAAVIIGGGNTFIAGSSMGGLISMYGLCEYPNVFGGAACLSTHWPGTFSSENNPIPEAFKNYLQSKLKKIKKNKIYFDYGNQTLDAMYPPLQQKVDEMMKANGLTENNWITKYFPGKDHSEKSWAERLHFPLEFLLKN